MDGPLSTFKQRLSPTAVILYLWHSCIVEMMLHVKLYFRKYKNARSAHVRKLLARVALVIECDASSQERFCVC